MAAVTSRMLSLLPAGRAAALADGPVTIDLDTTDVEVYGRKKRGVAWNHQGQRVGRPHVAAWAEAEIVLAADLGDGTDDPRTSAPDLLRRALAALPQRARQSGRVAMRADAGYFAGQLARAAHEARIGFAIGARRIAPLWRLLAGIVDDDWHDAIEMDGAEVAVADYCPDWWPADTRLPACGDEIDVPTGQKSDATGRGAGPSELGLEFVDLVHSVLELGVGRVFADAADGPAQDLGAAVSDARGDQRVHGRQVGGPEPGVHGGQLLGQFIRRHGLPATALDKEDGAASLRRLARRVRLEVDPIDGAGQLVA